MFTKLWQKPETRDERVKEYVPEVLEESLTEQRKVLAESTSRDVIVDAGHRILREIENKAATPAIAPHLNKILLEFGAKDVIGQRSLSYLLYPSTATANNAQPHELVSGFVENFKSLVEHIEQNGRTAAPRSDSNVEPAESEAPSGPATPSGSANTETNDNNHAASQPAEGEVIMAKQEDVEPLDATLFVKLVGGMAMCNLQTGDLVNAVKCCDAGLKYAIEPSRIGGLYGLKAGILNRQKKFELAAEAAALAIQHSSNIQGFLQGAAALKALKRFDEVVGLLEEGRAAHPKSEAIGLALTEAKKTIKLSLTAGGSEASSTTAALTDGRPE